MITQIETKTVSLNNLILNLLRFMKREDGEIKIIIKNLTTQRIIANQNFDKKNDVAENIAWENMILWLEDKKSLFSIEKNGTKPNGAVAVKKDIEKFGCSVYGLPHFVENIFLAIKILEFHTKISFEDIVSNLQLGKINAHSEREILLEMNEDAKKVNL